jgi:hypothetical protein
LLDRAWNMRTSAAAVLALAAATLLRAPIVHATTAADICLDADPCLLERIVAVTPGSTLDFGSRAFVIKAPDGRLEVGVGDTLSIKAGSMTIESGPGGRLRGQGDCLINIDVAGAFALAQGVGVFRVAIDLSAKPDVEIPCELNVTAGGDTTIDAEIQARGNVGTNDTFASPGGDLLFQSAGRISVSDHIDVSGPVFGGFVEIDAAGAIEVAEDGIIDASDVVGEGDILLDAGESLTTRGRLEVSGSGERPDLACDGGSILLLAGGDITIAGPVSGTGATSQDGCFGGALEMTAGRDVLVNAPIDFSAGAKGQGGFVEEVAAGRDFVQNAPILVNAGRVEGSGGVVAIRAAGRLHVGALLDLSGGSLDDPSGVLNSGGTLVLQGGESVEIAGEVDGDGADFGSMLFTTASASSKDIPGAIRVTGNVHALSSTIEDFSADVRFEACDIEIATGASVTKTGPASRNLLRASGTMRIAGALDAGSGTNELHHHLSRPPLILPGATVTPPPLITAAPAEALRPCACTLESGTPGLLCNDGNPCTQELCDADVGCTSVPLAGEGIAGCDDGTVCNGRETCEALGCVRGSAPVADDGDPCTVDGACDPVIGYPRTLRTGLDAAACRMDRIELALATADIPEELTLKAFEKIGNLARSIRALVGRAGQATGKRRTKLLRSAKKKVARLDRAITAPKSRVSPTLAQLFSAATSETRAVLGL